MSQTTNCYRVWFKDGSALLVNSTHRLEAGKEAKRLATEQGGETYIERIEKLTGACGVSSAD